MTKYLSEAAPVPQAELDAAGPPPIIFCPVCTSRHDAAGWGSQEARCDGCETRFAVHLEPAIVAAHSLY